MLTQTTILGAPPGAILRDDLVTGLHVRVFPGRRSFYLYYKSRAGKQRRPKLGDYPSMTLPSARQAARAMLVKIAVGHDPAGEWRAERRQAVAASDPAGKFAAVADRFLARGSTRLRATTLAEYKRTLKGADVAAWDAKPLDAITRADVCGLLDKIDARDTPSMSNHALAILRVFFNWCADLDLIETPPTDRLKARHPASSRERVLSVEELRVILAALDGAMIDLFSDFCRLLLLTGQRRSEVAGMKWSEIRDLDGAESRWEIPGARTKNHRDHIVPLAPTVVAVLRRRRTNGGSEFVFSGTGRTPVSGFSKAKCQLDDRVREVGRPLPGWTWHDLRRTMVTGMNELWTAPHVVEAVVNHVSGAAKAGVAGVYNRALYMRERRDALTAWAAHVERLSGG